MLPPSRASIGMHKPNELSKSDAIEKWPDQHVKARFTGYIAQFNEDRVSGVFGRMLFQPPGDVMNSVSFADSPVTIQYHLDGLSSCKSLLDTCQDFVLDLLFVTKN